MLKYHVLNFFHCLRLSLASSKGGVLMDLMDVEGFEDLSN